MAPKSDKASRSNYQLQEIQGIEKQVNWHYEETRQIQNVEHFTG